MSSTKPAAGKPKPKPKRKAEAPKPMNSDESDEKAAKRLKIGVKPEKEEKKAETKEDEDGDVVLLDAPPAGSKAAQRAAQRAAEQEQAMQDTLKRMNAHFAEKKAKEADSLEIWRKADSKAVADACFVGFYCISNGLMGDRELIGSDPLKPHVLPQCVWGVVPGVTTWVEMLTRWPQFRHLCTKGEDFGLIERLGFRLALKGPKGEEIELKDGHKQPGKEDNTLRDLSLPILPAGAAPGSSIRVYIVLFGSACDMLQLPLRLLSQGRSWPPCSNWGGNEPITMLTIGAGRNSRKEHHCPLCSDEEGKKVKYTAIHDNSAQNIIVSEGWRIFARRARRAASLQTHTQHGASGSPRPSTRLAFSDHHLALAGSCAGHPHGRGRTGARVQQIRVSRSHRIHGLARSDDSQAGFDRKASGNPSIRAL
jgi:hypothetical protein